MKFGDRKKIIFISTMHRSSERIIEAIARLQEKFDVTIFNIGQSSEKTKFAASLRYHRLQKALFKHNKIIQGPHIKVPSDTRTAQFGNRVSEFLMKNIDSDCDAIITDDGRSTIPFIRQIYNIAKKINKRITVFGNCEGLVTKASMKVKYGAHNGKCYFDYFFCFWVTHRHFEKVIWGG